MKPPSPASFPGASDPQPPGQRGGQLRQATQVAKALHMIMPERGARYAVGVAGAMARHYAVTAVDSVYIDASGRRWLAAGPGEPFTCLKSLLLRFYPVRLHLHDLPGPLMLDGDFWPRYADIGICAIDTEHALDDLNNVELRWTRQGRARICRWCGQRQVLQSIDAKTGRNTWRSL